VKPPTNGSDTLVTIVGEVGELNVPHWVTDIHAFRRWLDSDEVPEDLRIWWLCGKVWADMSREQIFTHLALKGEFHAVLTRLVKEGELGLLLPDGLLLSNFEANVSGNPDATFVSNETLASERIRLIEGCEGGYTEMQGSPDMVLEVLSRSSVTKDTVTLREAYWKAGVREYWLADARRGALKFDVLRHTARGFAATAKKDGWVKPNVFGKAFRLTQSTSKLGHPEYTLQVR
jgi:Uma2 family endonuclease